MGIDAPMWWSASPGGGRKADDRLRTRYGIPSGTVQSANSLRGAAPRRWRATRFPSQAAVPRHTHHGVASPRPCVRACRLDEAVFADRFGIQMIWQNEHERDAAIGAVCAREGFEGRWQTDLAEQRDGPEQDPRSYWLAPMCYFWPEAVVGALLARPHSSCGQVRESSSKGTPILSISWHGHRCRGGQCPALRRSTRNHRSGRHLRQSGPSHGALTVRASAVHINELLPKSADATALMRAVRRAINDANEPWNWHVAVARRVTGTGAAGRLTRPS